MEMLVTVAVILVLIGVLAMTGKKIRQRSEVELTRSILEVLDSAMEVYYDRYHEFVPMVSGEAGFDALIPGGTTITQGTFPAGDWDNAALYYFLSADPQSRAVLNSLVSRMITNQDASGLDLMIQIPTGSQAVSWIRVLDAWKTPLDYEYNAASDTFPTLRSAGPDKVMHTEDDVTNL